MKKLLLAFILYQSSFILCNAQQINLDSLYSIWRDDSRSDSIRIASYTNYLFYKYSFSKPDSLIIKADELLKFSEKQNQLWGVGSALNLMGAGYFSLGNYPQAMFFNKKALNIREEIGDKKGVAGSLNNIANIYTSLGNYPYAIDYLKSALKINEEINNYHFQKINLQNIGLIYQEQRNFEKAIEYYNKSLAITEITGGEHIIASTLNNLAEIYTSQRNYDKALEYYKKSIELFNQFEMETGLVHSYMGLGLCYAGLNKASLAQENFEKSLELSKKLDDKLGSSICLIKSGEFFQKQKEYSKSLENCKMALALAEEIGSFPFQKEACACLYNSFKALGQGNEALVFLEKLQVIDDSLHAEETAKKLQQMEFEKALLQDSIAKAEEARLIQEAHEEEMRKEEKTRNIGFGIGGLVLLLAGGLYSRLRYVRRSKAVLQIEKDRSENLLLNILPEEIARELKEKGKADARDFDTVSILFTDFKGFTEQSAKLSAAELVNEINHCFEAFDDIMEKHGIEKIKTIGDAYMAAGGLPVPTDDSVKNTVLAALEMQAFISKRKTENEAAGKPAFEMRVGIHTGPVVAGIVGLKKFQYDIWGDTVNTASRMESNGSTGKVNVSSDTYALLKSDNDFQFEEREEIEVKGKGKMKMYYVSQS